MSRAPLAVWIFGPIGAGKSTVLKRLPLTDFRVVDQDDILEKAAFGLGLSLDCRNHSPAQRALFAEVRAKAATRLWLEVPGWRAQRRDLAFETTGDKPWLFRTEIEAGRAHGYRTLGCALAAPLEECLRRNAARARVLLPEVVGAAWSAFEQARIGGVYHELFQGETLYFCASPEEAVERAAAWLREI